MAHTPEDEPKSLPHEEDLEELAGKFFRLPPDAIDGSDLEDDESA